MTKVAPTPMEPPNRGQAVTEAVEAAVHVADLAAALTPSRSENLMLWMKVIGCAPVTCVIGCICCGGCCGAIPSPVDLSLVKEDYGITQTAPITVESVFHRIAVNNCSNWCGMMRLITSTILCCSPCCGCCCGVCGTYSPGEVNHWLMHCSCPPTTQ
jgi:hypothetical protein